MGGLTGETCDDCGKLDYSGHKCDSNAIRLKTLPPKWFKLAGELLQEFSDQLSNNGCNDWNFPRGWNKSEQQELVKAMNDDNNSPEEYDHKRLDVPDWWVAVFLGKKLVELGQELEKGVRL